jgi:nitrate/nitrite transport system ATP-binding protein
MDRVREREQRIMIVPLELTGLSKTFETPNGPFTAVKNVNVQINGSEFVCILGHSGCGKSTVLSIVAGLQRATEGGVVINGRQVDSPGLERAVVFQSPCLLPWMTARENVRLAVHRARPKLSRAQQIAAAEQYLELTGVVAAASALPAALSLGMQQCVSLARALALEPRFLLLDEPFSMLDSLTRFELQDTLLRVWEQRRRTVLMVTHDIDEALYLADRLVLMTDGPEAHVGETLRVPFARPRVRSEVLAQPDYYGYRRRVIDFLENHAHQSSNKV